jgi:dephospho-CoA kinase
MTMLRDMSMLCREGEAGGYDMIVVGGDVGAGKSTHARLLVKYLNVVGRRAVYRHVKTFHLAYTLLALVLLIRYRSRVILRACKYYSPIRILYVHDRRLLVKLFDLVSLSNLTGLLLRSLIQLHLTKAFNRVIVVEDHIVGYTNDMVYFLSTLKGDVGVKAKRLWLLGFNYLLKMLKDWNAVIVFLYADLEVLRERWRKRDTAEELFEYILAGRVASRILSNLIEIHHISTSRSLPDVFRDIVSKTSRIRCYYH